jgi:hypothetical protein
MAPPDDVSKDRRVSLLTDSSLLAARPLASASADGLRVVTNDRTDDVMEDTHHEDEHATADVYESDELVRLGIDARKLTVVRPSGSTIVEIGEQFTVTIDLWKPISDGLPWTIDVFDGDKRSGNIERVAERVAIEPAAPSMPDPGVIQTALDLWRDWFRADLARIRAQRKALRLLTWISGGTISTELQRLVGDDQVSVSCELTGADVVYRVEIWAGAKPSLSPSDLFAD